MDGYVVIFKDNIAASARRLDAIDNGHLLSISKCNGRRVMNWLVVCGQNEHDAIASADRILRSFWAKYLNIIN